MFVLSQGEVAGLILIFIGVALILLRLTAGKVIVEIPIIGKFLKRIRITMTTSAFFIIAGALIFAFL